MVEDKSGKEEREWIIFLTETKQNYPRKTCLHISAPTNLQLESRVLMTESNNVYRRTWEKRK